MSSTIAVRTALAFVAFTLFSAGCAAESDDQVDESGSAATAQSPFAKSVVGSYRWTSSSEEHLPFVTTVRFDSSGRFTGTFVEEGCDEESLASDPHACDVTISGTWQAAASQQKITVRYVIAAYSPNTIVRTFKATATSTTLTLRGWDDENERHVYTRQ